MSDHESVGDEVSTTLLEASSAYEEGVSRWLRWRGGAVEVSGPLAYLRDLSSGKASDPGATRGADSLEGEMAPLGGDVETAVQRMACSRPSAVIELTGEVDGEFSL